MACREVVPEKSTQVQAKINLRRKPVRMINQQNPKRYPARAALSGRTSEAL
jgi:hypothetical protein